jgi:capsular polysaccharide transport system permease protein
MAQATYPSETASETATGSRSFKDALSIRAATRRARRRRKLLYLGIVVAAVLCALAYGAVIAAPRYSAEARFSVTASAQGGGGGGGSPTTSLISTGSSQGAALGFVDGFAINDFLASRDCMRQLGKVIDLRALLGHDGDPLASLPAKPSEEQLFRAYKAAVSTSFNMIEQVNVVQVNAFSPEASQRIAKALLAISQDFVARMDAQGVADTLDVSARQVHSAEAQDIGAANAIAQWRAANRNIDPQTESGMVMQMISQIEQELTTARINYEKVRAFGNPDHPMLKPAQQQVAALEGQLAEARGRLTGSSSSEAARLNTYEQLKNTQTFADNNLASARNAYQQAFLEVMRLRRYLIVIARPVLEDEPSSPKLPLLALEGCLAGILLAFVTSTGLGMAKANED